MSKDARARGASTFLARRLLLMTVGALLLAAVHGGCGGSTGAFTSDAGLPEASTPNDVGAPADACQEASTEPRLFCCEVAGQRRSFASVAEVLMLVDRRWVLCGGTSIANQHVPDPAGMDLNSDGTFQLLVKDPTGALVPYVSPDATGTFQIVFGPLPAQSGGSVFQFEFDAQSGQQYGAWQAMVTDSPRMMLMDELATGVFGYVPESTDGWPETEVPQPSPGVPHPVPEACGAGGGIPPGGNVALESGVVTTDGGLALEAQLAGDWLSCAGMPFGTRTDYAGIRLGADGSYDTLVWDASGALAVATDFFDSGRFEVGGGSGATLAWYVLQIDTGLYDGYGGDIDTSQLPGRLSLYGYGTPSNPPLIASFIARSATGL